MTSLDVLLSEPVTRMIHSLKDDLEFARRIACDLEADAARVDKAVRIAIGYLIQARQLAPEVVSEDAHQILELVDAAYDKLREVQP